MYSVISMVSISHLFCVLSCTSPLKPFATVRGILPVIIVTPFPRFWSGKM